MQSVLDTAGADKPSTLQWIEYGALKGLPFLILLILLVLFATRSEEKNFRAIVAGEPDPMVITEPEITSLRSLIARRSARSAAGRIRGPMGSKLTGQLQTAQIEYAMIRSRVDSTTDPALDAQRLKIRGIREQLGAVPFLPSPAPRVVAPAPVNAPAPAAPVEAATAEAAEPEPAAQPAAPPIGPAWAPTHLVPPGGMAAWDAPDPSRPPIYNLPERLELVVDSRSGAWALVRAVNGWRGWVDGRRLVGRV
jgi:hypothetical protein